MTLIVDELEIGIPAMGKKEQEDIRELLSLGLNVQMMTWNPCDNRGS